MIVMAEKVAAFSSRSHQRPVKVKKHCLVGKINRLAFDSLCTICFVTTELVWL